MTPLMLMTAILSFAEALPERRRSLSGADELSEKALIKRTMRRPTPRTIRKMKLKRQEVNSRKPDDRRGGGEGGGMEGEAGSTKGGELLIESRLLACRTGGNWRLVDVRPGSRGAPAKVCNQWGHAPAPPPPASHA